MAFDTWKEKSFDDREFAENRRHLDAQGALRAGTKGDNTAHHPSRAVHRERFIPNTEEHVPHPVPDDHEPDFEGMMERKMERRRPTGDTW